MKTLTCPYRGYTVYHIEKTDRTHDVLNQLFKKSKPFVVYFPTENGYFVDFREKRAQLLECVDFKAERHETAVLTQFLYVHSPIAPRCDCGGEVTGCGHSHWCSIAGVNK
jgi:hypothetical protein